MFGIRALVCRSLRIRPRLCHSLHHRQDLHRQNVAFLRQNVALLRRSLHPRQDFHRQHVAAMFCQLEALRQVLRLCRRVHYLQDFVAVCLPAVVLVCAALSLPVVLETTTNGFRPFGSLMSGFLYSGFRMISSGASLVCKLARCRAGKQ